LERSIPHYQGISIWNFPIVDKGFLPAIIELEKNSFASIFKTKKAKELLFDPSTSIKSLLERVVGDEAYFNQYLFDQQFSHRGWSGLVAAVEEHPETLLSPRKISLHDLILFELLLEIDHLEAELGASWKPIAKLCTQLPVNLFEEVKRSELQEVLEIWQDAFEWSYYDEVLAGIQQLSRSKKTRPEQNLAQSHSKRSLASMNEKTVLEDILRA